MTETIGLFLTIVLIALLGAGLAAMAYVGVCWRERAVLDRELDRMHREAVEVSTQGVYFDPRDAS